MSNNLVEIFFKAALEYPNHLAIQYKNESITYIELAKKIRSTSSHLQKKGIQKNDKVMVFIPMSIQLYQTVLALFSLGAIVVFVDEWADRKRLRKALQVVPVDAIIAPKKYIWLAYILPPFTKIKRKLSIPNKLDSPESFKITNVNLDDTALITFTTGSTGLPKAADRTHQFLSEQFRILKAEIGATSQDKCLITLPIVLLSILGTGASGYIADFNQKKPEKLNAKAQLDFIEANHISLLISSPFFVEKLSEATIDQKLRLRKILTGGAPVFPNLATKIQKAFPESQNLVAYGSTEAEPISSIDMKALCTFKSLPKHGLPVGQPHEEIQIRIIEITEEPIVLDDSGWKRWEKAAGEMGEIIVAGPHVLNRYFASVEAFKKNKIIDGQIIWHRTGDSGRHINGNLYLNGRCKQLIKTDEEYLSLFITEYNLGTLPGVAIGTLINGLIAIETAKDADIKEIQRKIEELEIPNEGIRFLDSIPRDPRHFSKIDYQKLKMLL